MPLLLLLVEVPLQGRQQQQVAVMQVVAQGPSLLDTSTSGAQGVQLLWG
jgi:hypothetical protein